ncbi:hypothetical protein ACQ5SP_12660 [Rhodovulum sp. YNF3179]|uniref:hypothetical protein n=1 Tax=Rhodovulum sp. YNF3179 TaxID=3425127 RepID=UPI003D3537F3
MSRATGPNGTLLLIYLVALLAVEALVQIGRGALLINQHEGDSIHLADIVLRMALGEIPHLDFMTPVGIAAFAPFSLFVGFGMGIGKAILAGQILVAGLLLPAVWWAGVTRLGPRLAYVFGFLVLTLVVALVHGAPDTSVSISMHYNRWAWAITFVVLVVALVDPGPRRSALVDGLVLGLGIAALALIKATYVAAFILPVLVALLLREQWGAIVTALLAGLAVVGAMTLAFGVAYWQAYLADLVFVAQSEVRPRPGDGLAELLIGARFLLSNGLLLLAVALLRQSERLVAGVVLLLLVPGFVYVTYQNWGNDPQWLVLVAVLLLALRPERNLRNGIGWEMRNAISTAAVVAFALIGPSLVNIVFSPVRHAQLPAAEYVPILPDPAHADFAVHEKRAFNLSARTRLSYEDPEREARRVGEEPLAMLYGQPLPHCALTTGNVGMYSAMAADLRDAGFADGRTIFMADAVSGLWLFGAGERLEGGAPWYYGGLDALARSDLFLVPLCPTALPMRNHILSALAERPDLVFTEVRRSDHYILLERADAQR